MTFTLWVRYKREVCTDPQRRCYNGAWASSEMRWTEWTDLLDYHTLAEAEDTKAVFEKCNADLKDREYKISEKPWSCSCYR